MYTIWNVSVSRREIIIRIWSNDVFGRHVIIADLFPVYCNKILTAMFIYNAVRWLSLDDDYSAWPPLRDITKNVLHYCFDAQISVANEMYLSDHLLWQCAKPNMISALLNQSAIGSVPSGVSSSMEQCGNTSMKEDASKKFTKIQDGLESSIRWI